MKYLIVEDFAGHPVCFLFPRRVDHADMRDQLPYSKIVSGGYVELTANGLKCSGANAELEVKSRPQDAEIIKEALREQDKR